MQGRFKRDGGAAGDPESHGGAGRGPVPRPQADDAADDGQRGVAPVGAGGGRSTRATGPDSPASQDVQSPEAGSQQGRHASRMALRNWSIRTRLVSLLALPVVASATLGGLRIQGSLDNVKQLNHMKLLTDITRQANKLADALQDERDSSAGPITSGHPTDDSVIASRQETDRQEKSFESATDNLSGTDSSLVDVRSTVQDITRQLQSLKQIRDNAFTHSQYVSQTVSSYDQLITSLLSLSQDMAQATSNPDMVRSSRALAAFSSAMEYESIQRAMISAALANPGGPQLSSSDRLYAQTASYEEGSETNRFTKIYGNGSTELIKALDGGNVVITQADQYRNRVLSTPDGISQQPKSYLDWYDEADTKMQEMSRIEAELLDQMQQQALTLRHTAQRDALIDGALILLVLGVSLVGAFVVARSMIRSLRRLQDTAQEVAQKRLPDLVKQLSESDPQDLDTSVSEIGITTRDEIGRVARAFDDVHREAVRLAAQQALLRGNVNAMFTNLSRRSQGLIQRQLSLISELESREADPDQLSNLFKLDHLATRMRRNGENLLVLAGEEPGRRWTRPVPLVDVLRAAASEVEQYERIELASIPPTEVAGRVVNDLVHLLAELLENATSFSSPQTKVRVTGHALPDGRVLIEIHDTGIGLSPEDLADINERLANPPTVDVSVSRRMGLFVVGRLSLRHGIRIQLRPSESGGTTALVMLPVDLTQGGARGGAPAPGKRPATGSAVPSGSGVGQAIGRAAQLGAGAPQARGQVPANGPRPALTGNPDSGQDAPERSVPQPRSRPQPQTSAGLPTRQVPQAPAPAQAGTERPAPSWAQRDDRVGGDAPLGPGDQLGSPQSTTPFERPDFHLGGRGPGSSEFFASQRQRPPEPVAEPSPAPVPESAHGGFPDPADGNGPAADSGRAANTDFFAQNSGLPAQPAQSQPQFPPPPAYPGTPQDGGYPQDARTGEFRAPTHAGSGSDVFGPRGRTPSREGPGPRGAAPDVPMAGGGQDPATTGRFPDLGGADRDPQPVSPRGVVRRRSGGELPAAGEPMALPPATSPGDGRSPIFESLESDWFRRQAEGGRNDYDTTASAGDSGGGFGQDQGFGQDRGFGQDQGFTGGTAQGGGSAQGGEFSQGGGFSQDPGFGQGQGRGSGQNSGSGSLFGSGDLRSVPLRPTQGRPPQPSGSQRPAPPGPQRGRPEADEWRPSANDERWRRAEQVREPAAGGITPSGLPRRVPRANLVPGTAEVTPQTGPMVSRAPDDVRGRLTNLRRGIQQGRTAGSGRPGGPESGDQHGGNTHQQER